MGDEIFSVKVAGVEIFGIFGPVCEICGGF